MSESDYASQASQLAERIMGIEITSATGVFGTSDRNNALLALRKAAAEFVQAIRGRVTIPDQLNRLDQVEAALQAAHLVQVVSNTELAEYVAQLDTIHTLIDKEK